MAKKKSKARAEKVKRAHQPGGKGYRIGDMERNRALSLARRKSGVTRAQLAESLGIEVRRAARVLGQLADKAQVKAQEDNEREGGAKLGRHNRTLIFTATA